MSVNGYSSGLRTVSPSVLILSRAHRLSVLEGRATHLVYLRAFAAAEQDHAGSSESGCACQLAWVLRVESGVWLGQGKTGREERGNARTVERLGLLQEPLEPAAIEADVLELLDLAAAVGLGVVRELGALDEREDDGVLEAGEDGADAVERERVAADDEVLFGERHGSHTSCVGESLFSQRLSLLDSRARRL